MILVVNIDDGAKTYTATAIDLGTSVAESLTRPEGGRAVSREEFDEIVEEKMKEMGAVRGRHGSGGSRVIIRH